MTYKLLLLALIFSSVALHAQTTEEEYNYMKKGYRVQLTDGLDMKKGYRIEPNYDMIYSPTVNISTQYLIRTANNSVAGIILIYTSGEKKYYYAIPHPKTTYDIMQKALNDFAINYQTEPPSEYQTAYIKYMLQGLFQMITMKEKINSVH